jgi:hypothetical protein
MNIFGDNPELRCGICGCVGFHGCLGPKVMDWKAFQDHVENYKQYTFDDVIKADREKIKSLEERTKELERFEKLNSKLIELLDKNNYKRFEAIEERIAKLEKQEPKRDKCAACKIGYCNILERWTKFPFCPNCGNKN